MANPPSPPPTTTRSKIVATLLLGVVFIVVLGYRILEPNSEVTTSATTTTLSATPATPKSEAARETPDEEPVALPPVDMHRLLAYNPFRSEQQTTADVESGGLPEKQSASSSAGMGALITWAEERLKSLTAPSYYAAADDGGPPARAGENDRASIPEVAITAIVTGGDRPAALIGDKLHFENDRLDHVWRIVSIHPQGVVIENVAE